MRLADRHGRPLSEVLSDYPEWELPFWASWMAREPDSGRRVEIMVAKLLRTFISANSKKHHKPPDLEDLVIPDWWAEKNHRLSARRDVDALINAFSESNVPIEFKKSRGNH